MHPKKDSFSIVIIGAWNPTIFSPEWVSKYLSENGECDVSVAFPISDPTAPRKISFEEVHLYPGRKQLMISPEQPNLAGMQKCSTIIRKILENLQHTPVSSVGINYAFTENNVTGQIEDALMPSDTAKILESRQVRQTNVTRVLSSEGDNYILNFTLARDIEGYIVAFNYHYDLNDSLLYKDLFGSNIVEEHFDSAIKLSNALYGIELDGDEED